jgi:hypothetical protein
VPFPFSSMASAEARRRAALAREATRDEQRNLAIGTILEFEHTLSAANAILIGTVSHRRRPATMRKHGVRLVKM